MSKETLMFVVCGWRIGSVEVRFVFVVVLNRAGQAGFSDTLQFMRTDKAVSLHIGHSWILLVVVQYKDTHPTR